MVDEAFWEGFYGELEKIAASAGRLAKGVKARTGRRPISVSNLLKKDNQGTLFKKHSSSSGLPGVPTIDGSGGPSAAKQPKRVGEPPSREDSGEAVKREDGRAAATTLYGPSTQLDAAVTTPSGSV